MTAKYGQQPRRPKFESERAADLFRAMTKRDLWEIAMQFGMRVADDFTEEGAMNAMIAEKRALKQAGIL